MSTLKADYADLLEYETTHRLELERRFLHLGCPWGCDGSGWREVESDEDQAPKPLEVMVGKVLFTPCECNMLTTTEVKRPFST